MPLPPYSTRPAKVEHVQLDIKVYIVPNPVTFGPANQALGDHDILAADMRVRAMIETATTAKYLEIARSHPKNEARPALSKRLIKFF